MRNLKRNFVFDFPPHRPVLGRPRQAEEIPELVAQLADRGEGVETGEHRTDAMLLPAELAGTLNVRDAAVELEAGLEQGIEPKPRLPGQGEPHVIGAVVTEVL